MPTFEDARERVRELGGIWAGNEVIENEETGERTFVDTRDERKKLRLRGCEDRGRRGILILLRGRAYGARNGNSSR